MSGSGRRTSGQFDLRLHARCIIAQEVRDRFQFFGRRFESLNLLGQLGLLGLLATNRFLNIFQRAASSAVCTLRRVGLGVNELGATSGYTRNLLKDNVLGAAIRPVWQGGTRGLWGAMRTVRTFSGSIRILLKN